MFCSHGNRWSRSHGTITKMPHKPENDAGHGRQQFDEHGQRLAHPERREFGQINGRGDAEGHGDEERDDRGNERAEDERQRAELLVDRVPFASWRGSASRIVAGPRREPLASS